MSTPNIPPPGPVKAAPVWTPDDNGVKRLGHFGKSQEKKTKYVRVGLKLLEGPTAGRIVFWDGWFTEATVARTLQALRYMGLKSNNVFDINDPMKPVDQIVEAVLEHEEYVDKKTGAPRTGVKVAWINRTGGASVKVSDPMTRDEQAMFAQKMTSFLAKLAPVEGERAAQSSGAPAGGSPEEPPPIMDDDIPF